MHDPDPQKEGSPALDLPRTYIKAIENSVGSNLFRNRFYLIEGKSHDVLDDGDLSCAVYVSSILYLFGLISELRTTVKNMLTDIEKAGWYKIAEPRPGAVIVWDFKKNEDGTKVEGSHRHIGFYIDKDTAVSNDYQSRTIWRHHPTYGTFSNGSPRRDILAYYWHGSLNDAHESQ